MTEGEAAQILRVPADASPELVHRAYRARARQSHPDLLQNATADQRAHAQAEFVEVTQARDVLLSAHPSGPGHVDDATPPAESRSAPPGYFAWQGDAAWRAQHVFVPPYEKEIPRPPNFWAFSAWVALLGAAIAISYFGGPFPENAADLWLRLIPFGLAVVAFGATGREPYLVVALALAAITVGLTFGLASFGSLLSLEVLLVPVLALGIIGRRRMLRRRAQHHRRAGEH